MTTTTLYLEWQRQAGRQQHFDHGELTKQSWLPSRQHFGSSTSRQPFPSAAPRQQHVDRSTTFPTRMGRWPTPPGVVIERIFDTNEAPLAVLGEPGVWHAWPHNAVIRAPGRPRGCSWARFTPPGTPGLQPPVNGSICLRNETDLLCDEVRRRGYWPECADLPGLYARAVATLAAEIERRPRVSFPPGPLLFVDAGANVGACSLHMLLATTAHVVSFEPGALNLFHASSSFLEAQQQQRQLQLQPATAVYRPI